MSWTSRGRILVPQTLREFAGLDKDVVLTGNLNRIEVWSKEKWNENCNYDDMDSIAEEHAGNGNRHIRVLEMSLFTSDIPRGNPDRRRRWNLNTNLYYWKRPLTA